ncbi:MAG: tetratricopeptide repeat protein [Nitriliruptoraceae bacterium]
MTDAPAIFAVNDETFDTLVRQASHDRPVIVDFWAPWCSPCTALTPLLTQAVNSREGTVALATVNVDENAKTAREFNVRGIPNVFGFREGKAIAQFTGVQPVAQIEHFIDDLLPTLADQHVARARSAPCDEAIAALHQALASDPAHREAALGLAELVWESEPDLAQQLATKHRPDPLAERILTRLRLSGTSPSRAVHIAAFAADPSDGTLGVASARAYAAREDYDLAFHALLDVIRLDDPAKHEARRELASLFALLGDADPRVQAARPLLARALL